MNELYKVQSMGDSVHQVLDPSGLDLATCRFPEAAQTIAFALNALRLNRHPDSARLDHLIQWDHAKVDTVIDAYTGAEVSLEKIEFIFERTPGGDLREVVRAAIDRSMNAPFMQKADASAPTAGSDECPHGVDDGACKECYALATSELDESQEYRSTVTRTHALTRDVKDVVTEVNKARASWPKFNSAHEGYAVLMEEVDELKEHVWTNQAKRDLPAMRKEAMQIAAVALRIMAECCDETTGRK